jgi:hypothetical protein
MLRAKVDKNAPSEIWNFGNPTNVNGKTELPAHYRLAFAG